MNLSPLWALLLFQTSPGVAPAPAPAMVAPAPTGLQSSDPQVQMSTARSLGQKGDVAAFEPLVDALSKTSDPEVEVVIMAALEKLAYTPEFLTGVVAGQGSRLSRSFAIYTLGKMKSTQAVPVLIATLTDPDPVIRDSAMTTLGKLGDPRAYQPLLKAAHQDPSPTLRQKAEGLVITLSGAQHDEVDEETLLTQLQSPDEEVRKQACLALGQHGSWWAVAPLIKALDDPHPEVRERAIGALSDLGDKRAVAPLLEHLPTCTGKERYLILVTLGILQDESARETLEGYLKDPDPFSRRFAARALGLMKDKKSTLSLCVAYEVEKDPINRQEFVHTLRQLKDPSSIPTLLVALGKDNEETRSEAARALADIPTPEAVTALMSGLLDPNPLVRAMVIDTLLGRSDCLNFPELRTILEKMARTDTDPYAREAALEAVVTLDARARTRTPVPENTTAPSPD